MSPFKNARIVGYAPSMTDYNTELEPRGTPKYVVRSHALLEFQRNPHRWQQGYHSPDSKSKAFGSLLDCLALTPHQWPSRYCTLPADAPRRPSERQINAKKPSPESIAAIAWWDDWNSRNVGREVVTHIENAGVHAALARLNSNPEIAEFLKCGKNQAFVLADYTDPSTGLTIAIKGLLDIVPDAKHPIYGTSLGDLKTTRNASPRRFGRDCYQYGYHVSHAFYLDLWNAATGENREQFIHVVVENFPPYECRMPYLGSRFINLGRATYQELLGRYCRCVCSGHWPSYDPDGKVAITEPEDWMLDMGLLYEPLEEPEETEETEPETSDVPL